MSRTDRWAYMAHPLFNPPNDDCPECPEPSKTYHIGDRTVGGIAEYTWRCEHGHEWVVREPRPGYVPPQEGR